MANKKISELTIKTDNFKSRDLFEIAEDVSPGVFESKSINGKLMQESIISSVVHGAFHDDNTQTTTANTPTAMLLRATDMNFGVNIIGDTRITVTQAGIYNVQFSAQIYRTSGGTSQHIDIWLRKNGTDVPSSNTRLNVNANAIYQVGAWNWFIKLGIGEHIEIFWMPSASTIQLQYEAPTTNHPATPSVIATINRIH
jgi:hypothetical protein